MNREINKININKENNTKQPGKQLRLKDVWLSSSECSDRIRKREIEYGTQQAKYALIVCGFKCQF